MALTRPEPLSALPASRLAALSVLLCDIDDTLSTAGRLTASAYRALESLAESGIAVVPVTGRPAGWCDLIARFWPVAGVVGENGAFYFSHDPQARRMRRQWWDPASKRAATRERLAELASEIVAAVPGCAVAADQAYRETDLAIDFAEDVSPPLPREAIERIVALFESAGATAKVSSIHVNGWFGRYDKRVMAQRFGAEVLGMDGPTLMARAAFIGDSPNDAPMFASYPVSIGVANVLDCIADIEHAPRYVTTARAGAGFVELSERWLDARRSASVGRFG